MSFLSSVCSFQRTGRGLLLHSAADSQGFEPLPYSRRPLRAVFLFLLFQSSFLKFFSCMSGSHLLSHAVSSIVPSAARVLTIVFGMGTGVSPGRIATRHLRLLLITKQHTPTPYFPFLRKEVIQPHLPIRLPCYDFTPVTCPAFGSSLLRWVTDFGRYWLPWCDGRCVQDPGTYSPWHSDPRLLAIPASCSRVADYNPN